jgi:hypothetical protein
MALNIHNTLDIEQVSEVYKTMAELVYADMDKQYKEKKINGATYAETWAKLMSAVISGSLSTVAQLQMDETEMDRCVKQSQCDVNQAKVEESKATIEEIKKKSKREECLAQAECNLKASQKSKVDYEKNTVLPKQVEFTQRQIQGFDDNKYQKLLDIQMNAWAMMFSSGMMEEKPQIITSDEVSNLYYHLAP